jgi:hypothetical protein
MLALIIDENIHGGFMPGVWAFASKRGYEIDAVAATDVGFGGRPDEEILEWAAANGRVIVTLDVSTMIGYARDRVNDGRPMAGLLLMRKGLASGVWIEHLAMTAICYDPADMAGQTRFVPEQA